MTTNTAPKWHEGRLIGYDTETTGIDPHTASIVQAAVVVQEPGRRPTILRWLINPGVDIPTEASDVHGWTTERLTTTLGGYEAARTARGFTQALTREAALNEIAMQLAMAMHCEIPLVIVNAAYDLTLTEAELARVGVDPLAVRPSGIRGIVDPQVLDKQADKYRKQCGKAPGCDPAEGVHECTGCQGSRFHRCGGCGSRDRTLSSLCAHYGIPIPGAHDASVDALAGVRLARKLGGMWGTAGRLRLQTLHTKQIDWRREQADGLREYFDKVGKEHDGLCPSWPVHTEVCAHRHLPVAAGVAA